MAELNQILHCLQEVAFQVLVIYAVSSLSTSSCSLLLVRFVFSYVRQISYTLLSGPLISSIVEEFAGDGFSKCADSVLEHQMEVTFLGNMFCFSYCNSSASKLLSLTYFFFLNKI